MMKSKRHFMLLEVLIAFMLVMLCAFPMLSTQVFLAQREKQAWQNIDIDRLVNIVLVYTAETLFEQKYEWKTLQEGATIVLPPSAIDNFPKNFPYEVSLSLKLQEQEKEGATEEDTKHLLNVMIAFRPLDTKQKTLFFPYKLFLKRHLLMGQKLPLDDPNLFKDKPKPQEESP